MRVHAVRAADGSVEIVRERVSRASGRTYAQRLDPRTRSWEYLGVRGLRGLSDATLLDLDTARQYGLTYGICAVCGALLTAHDSVASGIGPVCASKLGIARSSIDVAPLQEIGAPAPGDAEQPVERRARPADVEQSTLVERPVGRAWLDGARIAVDAPYDSALVEEMRAIPGRRWDPERQLNLFPADAVTRVTELCERWRIDCSALASVEPGRSGLVRENDRLMLRLDARPDDQLLRQLRAIPGRRWDPERGVNTFPFAAASDLAALAADWPEIDWSAAQDVLAHADAQVGASAATDAHLDLPAHLEGLLPFQRAGVAYALEHRRVLIADQPGLGKTVQALAALDLAGAFPAVVVVPETLRENWRREAARWLPHRTVEIARTRTPGMLTADITAIGYAVVDAWQETLCARAPRGLVVDEAHACKTGKARRTKAVRALSRCVPDDGLILLLTGTPILNCPDELVAPLQILRQIHAWGGVTAFRRQHCYQDSWGRWSGAQNLDVLNRRLRATCMVRREKQDVLAELPPKRWAQIVVEHSNIADYRRAEREFLAWLAERTEEAERDVRIAAAMRAEVLVRLTALRKHAALGKLDAARQWIADFRESGRPLVVAAHHRDVLDTLARELGAPVIMGGQSEQARQAAVDRFQAGDADIIVVGIAAGGVGITLHRASDVLVLERPWTWAALEQMADRVHRIGQDQPVTVWLMDAAETVDERLASVIDGKRRVGEEAIAGQVAAMLAA